MAEEAWRLNSSPEQSKNNQNDSQVIGTTKRGIGPCYADKAARMGFRIGDLLFGSGQESKLRRIISMKKSLIKGCYGYDVQENEPALDVDHLVEAIEEWRHLFGNLLVDDGKMINDLRTHNQVNLIFEGAQSFGIDLEYGRYPFVSSSINTIGGAVVAGAHNPLSIGVTKCYTIAVGHGPMPTEFDGELSDWIAERGKEYGTTTGRRRRIGWLDLPLLRRAVQTNKLTALCVTNIDVLAGLEKVGVCVNYKNGIQPQMFSPYRLDEWSAASPHIEFLPGWPEMDWKMVAEKGWKALPSEAQSFLDFLSDEIGVKVLLATFGRERDMFADRGLLSILGLNEGICEHSNGNY